MEIKILDKKYNIPDSWSDITLRQFKEIMLLDDNQEELPYKIAVMSILLDCNQEDLEKVSLNSLNSIWNRINLVLESKPDENLDYTINLGSKEFYFDNQLENNTSYGMFVDVSNFLKEKNFWEVAEKVLAIYVRPVQRRKKDFRKWFGWKKDQYPDLIQVEKYDSSKLDEYAELLLDCPMSFIFPISVFFWTLLKQLNQNIQPSSLIKMNQDQMMDLMRTKPKTEVKTMENHSMKDGDGI